MALSLLFPTLNCLTVSLYGMHSSHKMDVRCYIIWSVNSCICHHVMCNSFTSLCILWWKKLEWLFFLILYKILYTCDKPTWISFFVTWQHQAITWINVNLSSKVFFVIHVRATSHKLLRNLISNLCLGFYTFTVIATSFSCKAQK